MRAAGSERPRMMMPAFPTTKVTPAPVPCQAGTLFSGNAPTMMTPSPEMAIAARPAATRLPPNWRRISTEPAIIVTPSTMNDAFITPCSGEHTSRPP